MSRRIVSPYALDEFFASGYDETENPFITATSRKWGKYVALIGASVAAVFLLFSYISSFFSPNLTAFFLIVVYFLAGTPALIDSLRNLQKLNVNIEVLMTLAALLSVLIGSQMEGGLLLVLFALSAALEETVTKKTKGALNTLHKLSPTMAFVLDDTNTAYPKSVREIELGMKILVKAGEVIPLDGEVVDGTSYVNLSHLTGESIPVPKEIGDEVQAGSMNTDGTLTVVVTKTSADSTLAKIIKLITEAQEAKPKLQRFLDKFSRTYATSVILIAFLIGLSFPYLLQIPFLSPEGSIYRALAFLIAASPCALIIATPTAYLSAISACAKKGILLKGGVMLDALARCKMLAIDKTGTLTTGKLVCQSIDVDGDQLSQDEGIALAAALERGVVHPIADAIVRYAKEKQLFLPEITDLKSIPGKGVEGTYDGETITIGNSDFIFDRLGDAARQERIEKLFSRAGNVITLLLAKNTLFVFHFQDDMREGAKELVDAIHSKLDVAMLTGDHRENADYISMQLGIQNIYADLKPEDKMRIISDLSQKTNLAMVGDGINDAPALTRATVGIAMGEIGSATAIEAADVVLLRDDLSIISWLFKRSKSTMRIVGQNLTFALAVIILNSLFSIFGLIPLWLAVTLHEGSTVLVGLNSLRLLKK